MPGFHRSATATVPLRPYNGPAWVLPTEAKPGPKHSKVPSEPKPKKKKKKSHATASAPQTPGTYSPSPYTVYDGYPQPHAYYYTNWTVPVKRNAYYERVAIPWNNGGNSSDSDNSSTESLNGWTPWASWQRAHANSDKHRDLYKGRTFETVPVASLNLEDHHIAHIRAQKKQSRPQSRQNADPRQTDGSYVKPQNNTVGKDDGIRVKPIAFDNHSTQASSRCNECPSPLGQTYSTASASAKLASQEWVDSDRSFIEAQGLGPAVARGLLHYPKTPAPSPASSRASSRAASDKSSVKSWNSEWRMRHLV